MHKKRPKICTGCRVNTAKIYHSTKIAKAKPHSEEWQTDSSVQKQWSMTRRTTALIVARHPLYPLGHLNKGFSFLWFLWESMNFHPDWQLFQVAVTGDQIVDPWITCSKLPPTPVFIVPHPMLISHKACYRINRECTYLWVRPTFNR